MENHEFFRNFQYPKAEALGKSAIVIRRVQQLAQIFFSKRYQNFHKITEQVIDHYSHQEEVEFYSAYSGFGLHPNERQALDHALLEVIEPKKILVIGSGVGRECFAISKQCPKANVLGIDFSNQMIKKVKSINSNSNISFKNTTIDKLTEKFDLIWVTAILESHIQGAANRVALFKNIKFCLNIHGRVVFTPQIKKLHWRSHYYWSSQLLRLRWLSKDRWQPGDVLLAHLGAHRKVDQLVFSHFYPTEKHFTDELGQAGLSSYRQLSEESWVVGY